MNICESLTVTAKLYPDKAALQFDGQQLSYQELNRATIAAARCLRELGIRPGDRVALMLPNLPSFPIWYYATLRSGAIAVSISTRLAPAEVKFVVTDCSAKVFVASDQATEAVPESLPTSMQASLFVNDLTGIPSQSNEFDTHFRDEPEENQWYDATPDEPALILYTSGTTGFPKGATLSHGNVRSNVHAFNHLCDMRLDDRVLLAVPLFHCFGQNALLNSVLNVGGTIVLQQRFDLNESKRLISEHRITQLYGVPMMFGLLLDSCSTDDLSSVRYCFSAAATLPIQTSLAWREKFGLPIFEGYGLTETSPFATYNHRIKFTPGSIGMPIDSVEIKIVDTQSGERCDIGELGEIAIRGPNVMLGYWNRPDETKQAVRDGWFHSGDIGRLDENGFLYIIDRVKDMITVGGLKVFPAEVERVLLDHEQVVQAAVVGVPDSVVGEQVIAFLVVDSNDPIAISDIEQHAKTNLGNYKIPRRFQVIEELPRNPSGKVLKTRLRELAAELPAIAMPISSPPDGKLTPAARPTSLRHQLATAYASEKSRIALEFLQSQIQELCELEKKPSPKDSFIEAGMDSLAIVGLSEQIQAEVGPEHTLPPTLLFDYPRIIDLADYMVEIMDDTPQSSSMNQSSRPTPSATTNDARSEIENMTEDEALAELMKELD